MRCINLYILIYFLLFCVGCTSKSGTIQYIVKSNGEFEINDYRLYRHLSYRNDVYSFTIKHTGQLPTDHNENNLIYKREVLGPAFLVSSLEELEVGIKTQPIDLEKSNLVGTFTFKVSEGKDSRYVDFFKYITKEIKDTPEAVSFLFNRALMRILHD